MTSRNTFFFAATVGRSLVVGKEVKNSGNLFAFHPPLVSRKSPTEARVATILEAMSMILGPMCQVSLADNW